MNRSHDARQYAPATERNRSAILEVLQRILPPTGTVLEIASGTGEHAVFFAPRLQPRRWLPSDASPLALASINAWRSHHPSTHLYPPIVLDVCESPWSCEQSTMLEPLQNMGFHPSEITAIVNVNMIHISPWEACLSLMAGANRILPHEGILYLYGPFKLAGQHTAPSNARFDESLRSQNPAWGVRNLDDVIRAAKAQDLYFVQTEEMPANNLSVVFQKQGRSEDASRES